MSNHLAIATVTATLQRLLQDAIQRDVDGARVTAVRPHGIGNGTPESGVNLFLYQVSYNTALKGEEMRGFRAKSHPAKRQSALDLYYVVSFYGSESELEPQRLLGSVVRTLSDRASITADMVRETVLDSTLEYLKDSDLAYQVQQMTISALDLELDELSKIWSVFFQAPYLLSVAYKVMAVVIDGEEPAQRSLPVHEPRVGIAPFRNHPRIERVQPEAGSRSPITANSTLIVQGQQLRGANTRIRLGRAEWNPRDSEDAQLVVALADSPALQLRAGVQMLQVIHPAGGEMEGDRPLPAMASNGFPVTLRPTLLNIETEAIEELEEAECSGQIKVQIDLLITPEQKVTLALNEWSIEHPASYLFAAMGQEQDSPTVTIPIWGVKPGRYLARLQVDGAESLLGVDQDPESSTFNWFNGPQITIEPSLLQELA